MFYKCQITITIRRCITLRTQVICHCLCFVLFSITSAAGPAESGGCLQCSADKVPADGGRDYANKGEGSGEEGSSLDYFITEVVSDDYRLWLLIVGLGVK